MVFVVQVLKEHGFIELLNALVLAGKRHARHGEPCEHIDARSDNGMRIVKHPAQRLKVVTILVILVDVDTERCLVIERVAVCVHVDRERLARSLTYGSGAGRSLVDSRRIQTASRLVNPSLLVASGSGVLGHTNVHIFSPLTHPLYSDSLPSATTPMS